MSNELTLTKNFNLNIKDLEDTQKMSEMLIKQKHYQKLGADGIFAVIQYAKSINADPLQCLNGGAFFVQGKIELSGQMMMSLIRQAGHSVTKDKRSTDTLCILHGRRADTGDTWVESFGVEDAKRAGLLSGQTGQTYAKYGKIMFQWRALSALARFLFPDILRGAYVQGEISEAPPLWSEVDLEKECKTDSKQNLIVQPEYLNQLEIEEIERILAQFPEDKKEILIAWLAKKTDGIYDLALIKKECYPNIRSRMFEKLAQHRAEKTEREELPTSMDEVIDEDC